MTDAGGLRDARHTADRQRSSCRSPRRAPCAPRRACACTTATTVPAATTATGGSSTPPTTKSLAGRPAGWWREILGLIQRTVQFAALRPSRPTGDRQGRSWRDTGCQVLAFCSLSDSPGAGRPPLLQLQRFARERIFSAVRRGRPWGGALLGWWGGVVCSHLLSRRGLFAGATPYDIQAADGSGRVMPTLVGGVSHVVFRVK